MADQTLNAKLKVRRFEDPGITIKNISIYIPNTNSTWIENTYYGGYPRTYTKLAQSTIPVWYENNYYDYDSTLLTSQPEDWETNYNDYYKVNYELLSTQPDNWSTNYADYFTTILSSAYLDYKFDYGELFYEPQTGFLYISNTDDSDLFNLSKVNYDILKGGTGATNIKDAAFNLNVLSLYPKTVAFVGSEENADIILKPGQYTVSSIQNIPEDKEGLFIVYKYNNTILAQLFITMEETLDNAVPTHIWYRCGALSNLHSSTCTWERWHCLSYDYGTALPSSGSDGQLFFKLEGA